LVAFQEYIVKDREVYWRCSGNWIASIHLADVEVYELGLVEYVVADRWQKVSVLLPRKPYKMGGKVLPILERIFVSSFNLDRQAKLPVFFNDARLSSS
jgi:hypothetical protein